MNRMLVSGLTRRSWGMGDKQARRTHAARLDKAPRGNLKGMGLMSKKQKRTLA